MLGWVSQFQQLGTPNPTTLLTSCVSVKKKNPGKGPGLISLHRLFISKVMCIMAYSANNVNSKYKPVSEQARQLLEVLRQPNEWLFFQGIHAETEQPITHWIPPGKPFLYPREWDMTRHIYYSTNGVSAPVTDEDRAKHPGKKDWQIMPWVASKNRTLLWVKGYIGDFDGKDFADPTEDGIKSAYKIVREKTIKRLEAGKISKMTTEKGLWNQAVTLARKLKYKEDPDKYKAMGYEQVMSLPVPPPILNATGGGWQGTWLFDKPYLIQSPDDLAFIQYHYKRWNQFTGGDGACKDPRRILRLVDTYNVKEAYAPNYPLTHYVSFDLDRRYSMDELNALVPADLTVKKRVFVMPDIDNPDGALREIVAQETPRSEYSAFAKRVAAAYNRKHSMVDELLDQGCTHGSPGRMSRPGEPKSNGIILSPERNGAWIFSSGDDLYNGEEYMVFPFDVQLVYNFNGDVEKAAEALAPDLGLVTPEKLSAFLADARQMVTTGWWKLYVPNGGRSDGNNRKLYDVLLDNAESLQRMTFTLSCRQLARAANSKGDVVGTCSVRTAYNFIQRMNGLLFDAELTTDDKGVTLYRFSLHDVVAKVNNPDKGDNTALLEEVFTLATTSKFHDYKADDAFASGTSKTIKKKVYEQLEGGDFKELLAQYLPPLGTNGLLVLVDVIEYPGTIAQEIADRRGLKVWTVRTALRKLEHWTLVDSEQEHKKAPKEYTAAPAVWDQVEKMTPFCKAHMIGLERYEKQQELIQHYATMEVEVAKREGNVEKLHRSEGRANRAAEKRIPTLAILHPDLTGEEIRKFVYAPTFKYRTWVDKQDALREAETTQAERDASRLAIQQAVDDLYGIGVRSGREAYFKALDMQFTKAEALKIAGMVKNYQSPVDTSWAEMPVMVEPVSTPEYQPLLLW